MGLLDTFLEAASTFITEANSFERVKNSAPNEIGIYIMSHRGRVMYIGRAIEDRPNQSTKGLRKRLLEHWRGAASCKAELFQHRGEITVKLRICQSAQEAKELEADLIRRYNTVEEGWNLRYED